MIAAIAASSVQGLLVGLLASGWSWPVFVAVTISALLGLLAALLVWSARERDPLYLTHL